MAKNDKKMTLSLLVGTEVDIAALNSVAKQLSSMLQKSGVNTAFSGKIIKDLEALSLKAKELFSYEFSDKSPKQIEYMKKELGDFVKQVNSIGENLESDELIKTLLPETKLKNKLAEIERDFKNSQEEIKKNAKSKTGLNLGEGVARLQPQTQENNFNKLKNDSKLLNERAESSKVELDLQKESLMLIKEKGGVEEVAAKKRVELAEKNYIQNQKAADEKTEELNTFAVFYQKYLVYLDQMKKAEQAKGTKTRKALSERDAELKNIAPSGKPIQFESITNEFSNLKNEVKEVEGSLDNYSKGAKKSSEATQALERKLAQLTSVAFLARKALQGAKEAVRIVKDLDKAMTGIAIVTNQTREQVWGTYDSFKALAESLSSTTQEIADAALLYYQQGLNTAEVMEVVKSTTIAAALAGIDFAEASDRMTAAIRGFDLEMSDSIRVTDSFSALAAYTAADFNELSYAMTKTASIAHTANMTLENTAAFLAKMIETTREAPENIGTAMKSIIARMAQINTNPLQALEDGTDFNKVQTSLRMVGISLTDLQDNMRPFDEIFLELGQKWEYIDRNTQSYIATTIAGNRQQSRFLALMSDFDRTMDMVAMSNNSAGESLQMFNTYVTGAEAASKRFKQSQIDLANSFLKSDTIIGLTNTMTSFLTTVSKVGPAGTAVAATMTLLGLLYIKNRLSLDSLTKQHGLFSIALGLSNKLTVDEVRTKLAALNLSNASFITKFKTIAAIGLENTALGTLIGLKKKEIVTDIHGMVIGQGSNTVRTVSTFTWGALGASILTATKALQSFIATTLIAAGPILAAIVAIAAITAAVAGVVILIYRLVTAQRRHNEELKENITISREKVEAAKNENASLIALEKRYTELTEQISLTDEEKEELIKTEEELLSIFPELIKGYDSTGKALYDEGELLDANTKKIEKNNEVRKENASLALGYEFELIKGGDYGDLFSEEEEKVNKEASKKLKASNKLKASQAGLYGADIENDTLSSERIVESSNAKKINYATNLAKSYGLSIGDSIIDSMDDLEESASRAIKGSMGTISNILIEEIRESSLGDPDTFNELLGNFESEYEGVLASLANISKKSLQGGQEGETYLSYFIEEIEALDSKSSSEVESSVKQINKKIKEGLDLGDLKESDPGVQFIREYTEKKAKEAKEIYSEISGYLDSYGKSQAKKIGVSTLKGFKTVLEEAPEEELNATKALVSEVIVKLGKNKELSKEVEQAFIDNDVRTLEGLTNIKTVLKDTGVSSEILDNLIFKLSKMDPITFDLLGGQFDKLQEKIDKTAELSAEMLAGGLSAEKVQELTTIYPQLAKEIQAMGNGEGFQIDYSSILAAQRGLIEEEIAQAEVGLQLQAVSAKEKFDAINKQMVKEGKDSFNWEDRTEGMTSWTEEVSDPEASKAIQKLTVDIELLNTEIEGMGQSEAVVSELYSKMRNLGNVNLKAAIKAFEGLTDKVQVLEGAQSELNGSNSLTVETLKALVDNDLLQYLELTEDGLRLAEGATEALNESILLNIKLELFRAMNEGLMQKAMDGTIETSKNVAAQNEKEAESWAILTNEIIDATAAEIENTNGPGSADAYIKEAKKKAAGLAKITFSSIGGSGGGSKGGSKQKIEIDPYYRYVDALQAIEKELGVITELEEKFEDDQAMLAKLAMQKIQVLQKQQRALHAANEARRVDIRSNIEQLRAFGLEVEYHADTNDLMISNLEMLEGRSDAAAQAIHELVGVTKELNDVNEEGSIQYRGINKEIKDATPTFTELFNKFKESEINRLGWAQDDINFLRRKDDDIIKWREKIKELDKEILTTKAKNLKVTQEERDIFIEKFGFMQRDVELLNETELEYIEINRQIIEQKKLLSDLANEKNKAVYHEDMGWVWETDTAAITKSQEDLNKLETSLSEKSIDVYNSEIDEKEKYYDEATEAIQERMDDLRYEIDATSRKIEYSYDDLVAEMNVYGLATEKNLGLVSDSFKKNNKIIKDSTDKLAENLGTTVAELVAKINRLAGTSFSQIGDSNDQYGGSDNESASPKVWSTGSGYVSGQGKPGDIVVTAGGTFKIGADGKGKPIDSGVNVNASDSNWKSKVNAEAEAYKKKMGYSSGGVVDYTGDAVVHGSKGRSEVVFNSTDAKKLYELVHSTNTLLPKVKDSTLAAVESGIITNNTYNFDKLVLPNVKDGESFMGDLEKIRNIVSITGKN